MYLMLWYWFIIIIKYDFIFLTTLILNNNITQEIIYPVLRRMYGPISTACIYLSFHSFKNIILYDILNFTTKYIFNILLNKLSANI